MWICILTTIFTYYLSVKNDINKNGLNLINPEATEAFKTHNPGHNILELCNILVKIRFTTSKMKLDI